MDRVGVGNDGSRDVVVGAGGDRLCHRLWAGERKAESGKRKAGTRGRMVVVKPMNHRDEPGGGWTGARD